MVGDVRIGSDEPIARLNSQIVRTAGAQFLHGGHFQRASPGRRQAIEALAGRGSRGGGESTLSWAQRPNLMNLHCCRCSASIGWAKGKSSSTSTGPSLAWFSRGTSCPSQSAPAAPHQQPFLPLGEATTTARSEGGSHRQSQGKSSVKKRSAGGSSTPPSSVSNVQHTNMKRVPDSIKFREVKRPIINIITIHAPPPLPSRLRRATSGLQSLQGHGTWKRCMGGQGPAFCHCPGQAAGLPAV